MKISKDSKVKKLILISFSTVAILWVIFRLMFLEDIDFQNFTLSPPSRMLNGLTAAIITSMAFVLSLTANLYTPRLIGIFIKDPIVYVTFIWILSNNFLMIIFSLIPADNDYYEIAMESILFMSFISLAGVIPLLYHVISFLRPDYFLPLLDRLILSGFKELSAGRLNRQNYVQVIQNWDIISNIALTSIRRDDRQLVRLAVRMLDESLMNLIRHFPHQSIWRKEGSFFIAGLPSDDRSYLEKNNIWPEAYIFYKKSQILTSMSVEQCDLISDSCLSVNKAIKIAIHSKQTDVIDLFLMFMNTLMKHALKQNSISLFQILSYHYYINVHTMGNIVKLQSSAIEGWLFYGKLAHKKKLSFGFETVLYDCGSLLILISKSHGEDHAIDVYNWHIKKVWQENIKINDKLSKVINKALVKTYWELFGKSCFKICKILENDFLSDKKLHYYYFLEIKKIQTPLSWELRDRMLSFVYLDKKLIKLGDQYFLKNGISDHII